jgi:hypothetical protein
MSVSTVNQITARGVHNALGLSGGTGSIKDEQRIFSIHPFRFTFGVSFGHFFVPPLVAAGSHFALNLVADSLDNNNGLYGR